MSNNAGTGSSSGGGLGTLIGGIILIGLFGALLEGITSAPSYQPSPTPRRLPPKTNDNEHRNNRRPLRMNEYGECE